MAHIVVLVIDGELGAELVAVAGAAGHDVDVCASEADAWNACEKPADLLIIDASSDAVDGVTLVDSMLAGGELRGFARSRSTRMQIPRRRSARGRSGSTSSPRARAWPPRAPSSSIRLLA
jgi:CheY-like chemotaxis protein